MWGYLCGRLLSNTRVVIFDFLVSFLIVIMETPQNTASGYSDNTQFFEGGMSVEVKQIDHDNFEVTVSSDAVTHRKVKISNEAYYRYSLGDVTKAQLVNKAFLFLLRKEPNTSLLTSFSIEEIESYFPEFKNIKSMDWLDISI